MCIYLSLLPWVHNNSNICVLCMTFLQWRPHNIHIYICTLISWIAIIRSMQYGNWSRHIAHTTSYHTRHDLNTHISVKCLIDKYAKWLLSEQINPAELKRVNSLWPETQRIYKVSPTTVLQQNDLFLHIIQTKVPQSRTFLHICAICFLIILIFQQF